MLFVARHFRANNSPSACDEDKDSLARSSTDCFRAVCPKEFGIMSERINQEV